MMQRVEFWKTDWTDWEHFYELYSKRPIKGNSADVQQECSPKLQTGRQDQKCPSPQSLSLSLLMQNSHVKSRSSTWQRGQPAESDISQRVSGRSQEELITPTCGRGWLNWEWLENWKLRAKIKLAFLSRWHGTLYLSIWLAEFNEIYLYILEKVLTLTVGTPWRGGLRSGTECVCVGLARC